MHYSVNYSIQISFYETMLCYYKKNYPLQFLQHEFAFIAATAFT